MLQVLVQIDRYHNVTSSGTNLLSSCIVVNRFAFLIIFKLDTSAASLKNVRTISAAFVRFSRSYDSKSVAIKSSSVSEYRLKSSYGQSMACKEMFSLN